jgi:hypothetical protein
MGRAHVLDTSSVEGVREDRAVLSKDGTSGCRKTESASAGKLVTTKPLRAHSLTDEEGLIVTGIWLLKLGPGPS